MAGAEYLEVELAYNDESVAHRVPVGTTVRGLIERGRVLERHPEIDLAHYQVGIYAGFVELDTLLIGGDRVEIYRPLQADPKARRRRKAVAGRQSPA